MTPPVPGHRAGAGADGAGAEAGVAEAGGPDIYDPAFVAGVFDRCGPAYRRWSAVASFGFVGLWRRQCVAALPEPPGEAPVGYDLMAGTGEAWPLVLRRFPATRAVTAVDISSEMNRRALRLLHARHARRVRLVEADVLALELPRGGADFVVSTFGMKTFDREQIARFAATLAHVLAPGGTFSIIEASDPRGWALRPLYNLYLRRVLPLVERLFLRGAQDFAMIGVYTRRFGDCRHLAECLAREGLEVAFRRHFHGCATGVVGRKPRERVARTLAGGAERTRPGGGARVGRV